MLGETFRSSALKFTTLNLDSLTGLRFYAAMLVVVTHVSKNFLGHDAGAFMSVGSVGVSFFFVLSGFLLMWSRRPGQARKDFYRNRFARVYPLHALMLPVAVVLAVVGSGEVSLPGLVACVFLVQAWIPFEQLYFALNGPAWSLSCEAFFYALFPFLAKRVAVFDVRRLAWAGLGLYVCVCAVTLVAHVLLRDGPTIGLLYVNPAYRLWEFVLGIGLGAAFRQGWRLKLRLPAAATVTVGAYLAVTALNVAITKDVSVFGRLPMQALPSDLASLVLTPCFMALIAAAATGELAGAKSHLTSRPMVKLGKWSFALYISHLLVIGFVKLAIPGDLPLAAAVPVSLTVIAAVIGVSALLCERVEHPLEAKLRSPRRVATLP